MFTRRDVIEDAPDDVLDLNGWDLAQALRLMLKGNAVVLEWLMSPFVYDGDKRFRDECLALARHMVRPEAIARHYLHLGERQRRTYFADARAVPLKKLFYALRPALALRWMWLHPGEALVPMHFPTLMAEADVSPEAAALVNDLLRRKAVTHELGAGALPAVIRNLIDQEFERAHADGFKEPLMMDETSRSAADAFFRQWVMR